MTSALNQLIRDAFADSATDVFLLEDEPPRIRREGEGKQPLPSDADFSRQGGVSEARAQPIPAPGVSLLPSHRCD